VLLLLLLLPDVLGPSSLSLSCCLLPLLPLLPAAVFTAAANEHEGRCWHVPSAIITSQVVNGMLL